MQTSSGSSCASELVVSDGVYVRSAVDIWSCGVILHAMLAGYLPFDDGPANSDGPAPGHTPTEARDLLSLC